MSWNAINLPVPVLVAALFVRQDSVYKTMAAVDPWDAKRDALAFPGGMAIVAHPPCRLWGSMRNLSTAPETEKECGYKAIQFARSYGGVVEHPAASTLWKACAVPMGESRDRHGGYSLTVDQWHFGHPARKPTRLYVVGCPVEQLPPIPFRPGGGEAVVSRSFWTPADRRRVLNRHERERTPPNFAAWLVTVARRAWEAREGLPWKMDPREKQCPVCHGWFVPRTRGRPSTVCSATCRLVKWRAGVP